MGNEIKILQILSHGNKNNKIPIWLMRQAGRYLPEYKEIRDSTKNFLELCYDPIKATEVTIQPIKRFGFDAAIIFSDILVLPDALGWDVEFKKGEGPKLRQFRSKEDLKYLENSQVNKKKLEKVYETIKRVKIELKKHNNIPLIGFAGSPWTVVNYMLEGRGKTDFSLSKKFLYQNKELTKELIDFITEATTEHLINQIKSGADIIQLFDSWAGILGNYEYNDFVINPTKKIVNSIKKIFPNTPIIGFPRGSGFLYENYMANTGVDAIGVDQFVPIGKMQQWQKNIVVQGNLDPIILLTDKNTIADKVNEILDNVSAKNFIFNLGHGILPETPIKNVEFLIEKVRSFNAK